MLKNLYDLDSIKSDNYRKLDEAIVNKLVDSITEVGLQEPIHLFQIKGTGDYFVVSGHHRLEAMKRIKSDPSHEAINFQAYVIQGSLDEYKSQETAIRSVMANSLRQDMNIVDKSLAFQKLLDAGLTPAEISKMVNLDTYLVSKILSIAALPESVRNYIHAHPHIEDVDILKVALKHEQEENLDSLKELKAIVTRKKLGAKTLKPFNTRGFKKNLKNTGAFDEEQIAKILKCVKLTNKNRN